MSKSTTEQAGGEPRVAESDNQRFVWWVESGQYSSYSVHGVYSTRAKAKKVVDFLNHDDFREAQIVKVPLDPKVNELSQGVALWSVLMAEDGTVEQVWEDDSPSVFALFENPLHWWPRSKAPAYKDDPKPDAVTGSVLAKDAEHAVKIANEYRVQHIARYRK